MCTLMFIATLFTIAKMQKQPKCSSTDKWIMKMKCVHVRAHTHTHTHTHLKWNITQPLKRMNLAICENMDQPRGYYAK